MFGLSLFSTSSCRAAKPVGSLGNGTIYTGTCAVYFDAIAFPLLCELAMPKDRDLRRTYAPGKDPLTRNF